MSEVIKCCREGAVGLEGSPSSSREGEAAGGTTNSPAGTGRSLGRDEDDDPPGEGAAQLQKSDKNIILNNVATGGENGGDRGGANSTVSIHRWSFFDKRYRPVDWGRFLWLYPTAKALPTLGPTYVGMDKFAGSWWHVCDMWAWVPGKLLQPHRVVGEDDLPPDRDRPGDDPDPAEDHPAADPDVFHPATDFRTANIFSVPRLDFAQMFMSEIAPWRFNKLFQAARNWLDPPLQSVLWFRANFGWLVLNSQHGSDSAIEWNPFYKHAGRRPYVEYDQGQDEPTYQTEWYISDVAAGWKVT